MQAIAERDIIIISQRWHLDRIRVSPHLRISLTVAREGSRSESGRHCDHRNDQAKV